MKTLLIIAALTLTACATCEADFDDNMSKYGNEQAQYRFSRCLDNRQAVNHALVQAWGNRPSHAVPTTYVNVYQ
jgi:hypothetical protein